MQNGYSSFSLFNTHRDINDIPTTTTTTTSQFTRSSKSDDEPMIIDDDTPESPVEPNRNDHLQSLYNQNNPLMRSIFRSSENDNQQSSTERQRFNENDHNLISEATGFDATRSTELDADEAYALQLQQEEYARESLIPNQHPYFPFQVHEEHEPAGTSFNPSSDINNGRFQTDEQLAEYLQQQESRSHQRSRRQPQTLWTRQRPNPQATNESQDSNEPEIQFIPPVFRMPRHRAHNSDDDSDDNNPYMNLPHPFIQFLASNGQFLPTNFAPIFPGYRSRGHRRSGNIQDTEDDFGPEDYERLLQLDDTIRKKKLTKDQINSLKEEKFVRKPHQSDEEHKCSVCLDNFENNQPVRRFPCDHIYHKECSDRWLQENNVCPICREPPIKVHSSTNSRHNRNTNNVRRPTNTSTRNWNHRNNNNNNNNNNTNNNHTTHNSYNRRGPAPQRQS